jgi:hypothetical protein
MSHSQPSLFYGVNNVSRKTKDNQNYLDFVPVMNEFFKTETNEEGYVTIYVENEGVFHKIVRKIFRQPKFFQIQLEEVGSFIWKHIDGSRSIYEIGEAVQKHFGEKAEPLYPRLIQYFQSLQSYDFIRYEEKVRQERQAAADTGFFEEDREVI